MGKFYLNGIRELLGRAFTSQASPAEKPVFPFTTKSLYAGIEQTTWFLGCDAVQRELFKNQLLRMCGDEYKEISPAEALAAIEFAMHSVLQDQNGQSGDITGAAKAVLRAADTVLAETGEDDIQLSATRFLNSQVTSADREDHQRMVEMLRRAIEL